ncbi:targeting protein for Xklp2 isoform X2 [Dunckerocampus dactyliophorus]|nr:targeting protein for Xklp2 isoform X2 [Dunckerocampus dactyliophorus]XP_054625033.1 targeting protein for Xklp2 isoform X2 [Dunckerocampus dactyliophorus]
MAEEAGVYEYDAPSHVVDFKQLENEPCDDSWFDQQAIGQDVLADKAVQLLRPHDGTLKPSAIVGPMRTAVTDAASGAADSEPTSNAGAIPKTSVQPRRVSKRKGHGGNSPSQPLKKYKKSPVLQSTQKSTLTQRKRTQPRTRSATCAKPTTSAEGQVTEGHNEEEEPQATSSESHGHKEPSFSSNVGGSPVPRPVKSSMGTKKKLTKDPYVPVAQHIMQLQKRTPQRFHQLSRQAIEKGPPKAKGQRLQLTRPQSPNFSTRLRSRPQTVKSSAELEAEEAEELKFSFKAQELNKKILEKQEVVKKPEVKAPTVQEAFSMHIEKRLQERQATKPQEEMQPTFKAHELPRKILEGVVGVPDKKVKQPTVPHSPAFILSKRTRIDMKVEEAKPPSPMKPPPVPHFGVPFLPMLPEKRHTEVCPFSFEQREQEKRKQKTREQKEEVPTFKAQPLPHFDTVVLPERKKLEPTKPEPFRLLADERGSVKNDRWEHMVKEEQRKMKEAATFKARPNKITHKEPFQPKKEDRTAVGVEAFELATERRARDRCEFQQLLCEREALLAHMEEQHRREQEEKQKMEIVKLRQEQVHKAQPIRHYKTVEVKKSDAPLTVPKSPNFSDRFRL